jgi:hypothetical protein
MSLRRDRNIEPSGEFSSAVQQEKTFMRKLVLACLLVASTVPASAQSAGSPPANPNAKTPAINSAGGAANPGAPAAGANSFTEGQAKSRIEANGFSKVTDLKKDDAGVWRGKAMQKNKSVNVSVDFQGNVVGQ